MAGPSDPAPPVEDDAEQTSLPRWSPWLAPIALLMGLAAAIIGGLIVDLPAAALGVKITKDHTPPGILIADTFVQDAAFVLAAVYCARVSGSAVRAGQFGLRPPRIGWRSSCWMIVLLLLAFVILNVVWQEVFSPEKEKLLKELGTNEGAGLLVLSGALTCVMAPICEEFLFRGFVFTALRQWRGTLPAALITGLLFGGVHVLSAPALDLVPLAALGFGLCLLYRYTGSLYPGIFAHSLNNAIAFAGLESWGWPSWILLIGASLLGIALVGTIAKALGLIPSGPLASAGTLG